MWPRFKTRPHTHAPPARQKKRLPKLMNSLHFLHRFSMGGFQVTDCDCFVRSRTQTTERETEKSRLPAEASGLLGKTKTSTFCVENTRIEQSRGHTTCDCGVVCVHCVDALLSPPPPVCAMLLQADMSKRRLSFRNLPQGLGHYGDLSNIVRRGCGAAVIHLSDTHSSIVCRQQNRRLSYTYTRHTPICMNFCV